MFLSHPSNVPVGKLWIMANLRIPYKWYNLARMRGARWDPKQLCRGCRVRSDHNYFCLCLVECESAFPSVSVPSRVWVWLPPRCDIAVSCKSSFLCQWGEENFSVWFSESSLVMLTAIAGLLLRLSSSLYKTVVIRRRSQSPNRLLSMSDIRWQHSAISPALPFDVIALIMSTYNFSII